MKEIGKTDTLSDIDSNHLVAVKYIVDTETQILGHNNIFFKKGSQQYFIGSRSSLGKQSKEKATLYPKHWSCINGTRASIKTSWDWGLISLKKSHPVIMPVL